MFDAANKRGTIAIRNGRLNDRVMWNAASITA